MHLLRVYPDVDDPVRPGDTARERLRDETVAELVELQHVASASNAVLDAVPDYSAGRGLKRQAAAIDADLIVLGSAGPGRIGRIVLGDVARGVLHGAPCPVLDVAHGHRHVAHRPGAIGVAYDGSAEAEQALDLAITVADEHDARIEIVEAIDVDRVVPPFWAPQRKRYLQDVVGPANDRLAELARELQVAATGHADVGPRDAVLAKVAQRVDLMVCGSHAWGAPGRIALGSAADHLIHEAACPVLVVPRGVEAPVPHRVDRGERARRADASAQT